MLNVHKNPKVSVDQYNHQNSNSLWMGKVQPLGKPFDIILVKLKMLTLCNPAAQLHVP